MSKEIEIAGIKVPQSDWEATPPSIRTLVLILSQRLPEQDDRIYSDGGVTVRSVAGPSHSSALIVECCLGQPQG